MKSSSDKMFFKYHLTSSTFFRLEYIICFALFFASTTNFMLQSFIMFLNNQDPQLQYAIEYENDYKDVTIKNNLNQSYEPAITKVQIKSHSSIFPNIAMGVFKGFLSRALYIFSENYLA